MKNITKHTRICPICGELIEYTHVDEDGSDWLGHHYGRAESHDEGYDCVCDHVAYKRMCINCEFYNNGSCNNTSMVEDIKSKLSNDSPIIVQDLSLSLKNDRITSACNYWKLNAELLSKYFK